MGELSMRGRVGRRGRDSDERVSCLTAHTKIIVSYKLVRNLEQELEMYIDY